MPAQPDPQEYDLIITGGLIADGLGAPARRADLAISGQRIAAIGDGAAWHARHRIDASGKVVAPGFIDCHTHDDRALLALSLIHI